MGFAYATAEGSENTTPEIILQVDPRNMDTTVGSVVYIVYSSQGATNLTIDGVSSDLSGMIAVSYSTTGVKTKRFAATASGTSPVDVTVQITVRSASSTWSSSYSDPKPEIRVSSDVTIGVDQRASIFYAQRYADSVTVNGNAVQLPPDGKSELYNYSNSTVGVYPLRFNANNGYGVASDTCTVTVVENPDEDVMPKSQWGLIFVTPVDGVIYGDSESFVVIVAVDIGTTVTGTITLSQIGGSGSLSFANGNTISITDDVSGFVTGVSYTLAPGDEFDILLIEATMTLDGELLEQTVAIGAIVPYLDINLDSLIYSSADGNDLYWVTYPTIRAYDASGQVTDFAQKVQVEAFVNGDGNWLDRADFTWSLVGYTPGDTWVDEDSVSLGGDLVVPAEGFSGGESTIKVIITVPQYPYDLAAPYDENSAGAVLTLRGETITAEQYATARPDSDLYGMDRLNVACSAVSDGLAGEVTVQVADAAGSDYTGDTYDGLAVSITCVDFAGNEVQVGSDGISYSSSMEVSPIAAGLIKADVYFDVGSAVSPVQVLAQVTTEVLGYRPNGNVTKDITADSFEWSDLPVTSAPEDIVWRDAKFGYHLTVVDRDGNILTSRNPATTLTLVNADGSDSLANSSIPTNWWSGGVAEVDPWFGGAPTITGGSGNYSSVQLLAQSAGYEDSLSPVFELSDNTSYRSLSWSQGQDFNSPFTHRGGFYDGKQYHGFSGAEDGDGAGWTLSATHARVRFNLSIDLDGESSPGGISVPARLSVFKNDVFQDYVTFTSANYSTQYFGFTDWVTVSGVSTDVIKIRSMAADNAFNDRTAGNYWTVDMMEGEV